MVFKSKKEEKRQPEVYSAPVTRTPEPAAPISTGPSSFIGKTMDIKADIVSDEDVTIEGKVTGNIDVSKTLTIGENGVVKADIKAAIVRIIGQAKGTIIASEKVEILSRGRYSGNIDSQKLVVSEGAMLNGNINKKSGKR